MTRTTPLIPLLTLLTLSTLCLAQSNTTEPKPTWHFRGFADDNCQDELVNATGDNQIYCNDTPALLQSYRFTATSNPETGETFGLRLYVEQACNIPAIIYDAYEDGVGGCRTTVPYNSWNTFPW